MRSQKVPDVFSDLIEERYPFFQGAIEIGFIGICEIRRTAIAVIHEANVCRAFVVAHFVSGLEYLARAACFLLIFLPFFRS